MDTETKDKPKGEKKDLVAEPKGGALVDMADYDYGTDAGAGFENQTGEDVGIPFWVMMQPGSPEVQGEDSNVKAGMWMNRTTGEPVSGKEGLAFIPVITNHELVEWKPRDSGGGIVNRYPIPGDMEKRVRETQPFGQYKSPDAWRPGMSEEELKKVNDLVETFTVYGLIIDKDGQPSPGIINFSSTHIKAYKDWNYRMRMVSIPLPNGQRLTSRQLPMWAVSYCLRSEKNEKNGNTWYTPKVSYAGENLMDSLVKPGSELYAVAKSLYEAVRSGNAKADEASLTRGGEAEQDRAPQRNSASEEDAPY